MGNVKKKNGTNKKEGREKKKKKERGTVLIESSIKVIKIIS